MQYPMSYEECGLKLIEFRKEIARYEPTYWYMKPLESQLAELERMRFCGKCNAPREYLAWVRCPWCTAPENMWIGQK